jgi:RNA polymerase sigma-70 factor (ECF subfamily)
MVVETMNGRKQLDEFRLGSLDAFEALFHAHQAAVYRWILRMVRDVGAAEELTVESFWRIYQAHARFNPERGFEPWARRIATRAALDWMRRQRPSKESSSDAIEMLPAAVVADPAVTAEIRAKTLVALSRLPAKLRIAAMLVVVEELPQKEAAEALGISVAAVKVRVFRALRLLRKDLERQGI